MLLNILEVCGLLNNTSSFKGWPSKGSNYICWIYVPSVIIFFNKSGSRVLYSFKPFNL